MLRKKIHELFVLAAIAELSGLVKKMFLMHMLQLYCTQGSYPWLVSQGIINPTSYIIIITKPLVHLQEIWFFLLIEQGFR
jgi:hypothetical protein